MGNGSWLVKPGKIIAAVISYCQLQAEVLCLTVFASKTIINQVFQGISGRVSSNGRTSDSGSECRGSNPCTRAILSLATSRGGNIRREFSAFEEI